jgi:hypothetical protein
MVKKRQINSCHKVPLHVLLAELTGLLLSRWGAGSDSGELELRDGQKQPLDKNNIIQNRRERGHVAFVLPNGW